MAENSDQIAAVILAAGRSSRMGGQKLFLQWGTSTVIETIVRSLQEGGVKRIVVVSGSAHEEISRLLGPYRVEIVNNPDFQTGEMLDSLKVGIGALSESVEAMLVVLGDQPQLCAETVTGLIGQYQLLNFPLIVPSYKMRRGHPWLIRRKYWSEILALQSGETMRDFLSQHSRDIHYLIVETSSILMDLDTPEDYEAQMPR